MSFRATLAAYSLIYSVFVIKVTSLRKHIWKFCCSTIMHAVNVTANPYPHLPASFLRAENIVRNAYFTLNLHLPLGFWGQGII